MSDNIVTLLEDPDLRAGMGKAGRAHVRENFDLQEQTHKLEAIYQEVIGRGKRGRNLKPAR